MQPSQSLRTDLTAVFSVFLIIIGWDRTSLVELSVVYRSLSLFSKIGRARSHQPSHLLCLTTQDTGETPDNQHPGHRPAPTRWAGCLPFHQHVFHPLHLLDRPTSEAKHPSEHVKCSGVPDQNTMCQRKKTTRFRTNPTMIKLLLVVFKLPE